MAGRNCPYSKKIPGAAVCLGGPMSRPELPRDVWTQAGGKSFQRKKKRIAPTIVALTFRCRLQSASTLRQRPALCGQRPRQEDGKLPGASRAVVERQVGWVKLGEISHRTVRRAIVNCPVTRRAASRSSPATARSRGQLPFDRESRCHAKQSARANGLGADEIET